MRCVENRAAFFLIVDVDLFVGDHLYKSNSNRRLELGLELGLGLGLRVTALPNLC